jgi:acyl-CoA oxidase
LIHPFIDSACAQPQIILAATQFDLIPMSTTSAESRVNRIVNQLIPNPTAANNTFKQLREVFHKKDINISDLERLTEHDNFETRTALKKFLNQPLYVPKYNIPLAEQRELAKERLQKVLQQGFCSVRDFAANPHRIYAVHEILAYADGSAATKLTVQMNLFGGTVFKLGTQRHHKLLEGVDRFDEVGCFGLTELAYGNNAIQMETTATWDDKAKQFIINTPTTQAQKYWM